MDFSVRGIWPAMVTPLDRDGCINVKKQGEMVNYLIGSGIRGIFAVGTTGEFYGISEVEYEKLVDSIIQQTAGRVPIIIGATGITTRSVLRQVDILNSRAVEAVAVLTPMFIVPSDDELFVHYQTIAEHSRHPILLYNNPDRTGVNLSPVVVERLARLDNVIGIKDSSGNMTQYLEYLRRTRGERFEVLMGRDTLIYSALCAGGAGAVAASANIVPEICQEIYDKFQAGDLSGSLDAQFRLAPLRLAFSWGTFPAVIKEGLRLCGVDVGECMAPVGALSETQREKLQEIIGSMQQQR